MKLSLKTIVLSSLTALALFPTLLWASSASAQPTGMEGSYVGAGVSAGVTNGGQDGDAATLGGNIQGRLDIPKAPVSLRGAVLFSDETAAIMPIVSYDLPVSNNANVYVGAGYSFVEDNGHPTPLGNQDSVVLTAGAEAAVTKDVVVYGDAKWGIDAYQNSPASAVSLQAGVGFRF
ncbi:MAG: porin family protein [Scytolyngbya sp. HA4215-MV1]|nr:porin family protein [Scytolyngbya sp. HA4215-MV1]